MVEENKKEEKTDKDEEETMKNKIQKSKIYKGKIKKEREGICHIFTSFNNTIVHITDLAGKTIARVSGGMVTKHDRLKANPTVAMFVAKRAGEQARDVGINSLYVKVKAKTGNPAPGPGAHAAIKSLSKAGFKIISIVDITKVPRGGPKIPHGRRGRRV